jgi:hypothetical protein
MGCLEKKEKGEVAVMWSKAMRAILTQLAAQTFGDLQP